MKKRLIQIFGGLVVLAAAALVVVWFSLDSIVKKGVETIGPELTQVQVRPGKGVKQLGKGAVEKVEKAAKGLKDLLRK
jgi:cell division protein YceG involved in septum cleavage